MKKFVLAALALLTMVGCTGIRENAVVNMATDTAFVMALQNNPEHKPVIIDSLKSMKVFLAEKVTYDDLVAQMSKWFPGRYAYIGIILREYIATDRPMFETYLPMMDSYKRAVAAKIDRLLMLTGV